MGSVKTLLVIDPFFASVDDDLVSLVNVAHIIGHGKDGPRSDHELAQHIDKDGIANLIMLCLICHKIVDELEKKYSVETLQSWKARHSRKIYDSFTIPNLASEKEILVQVNDILEENATVFRECGPFSPNIVSGESGDGVLIWRRRCLNTILPNNQRIVHLIESNKKIFHIHGICIERCYRTKSMLMRLKTTACWQQKSMIIKLFLRNSIYL